MQTTETILQIGGGDGFCPTPPIPFSISVSASKIWNLTLFLALITMRLQWHLNSLYTQIQCSIRFDHSMAAITVIITSSGVALQFKAFGGGIMRRRASFNETRLLNRCRLPAYYAWHTLCCDWCTVSSCPLEYMLLLSSIHFRDARPMENRHKFDKTSVGQSWLYIPLIFPTNFVLEGENKGEI